ncbi:hypothetical protein A3SI_19775 [Nitritalea halalkaliphila LW7]|uniref:DUF4258 domain-containing protein n=1 Tax=Nitritalea halalkaliphila LW7 TaxID=1189621 RepID=I5BS76_9BACT|nr:hypothetical protein [Nitritalea halalkaliphila]EIM72428.1 hypothetical protein A3SI_19775 [Nitritalea halalkaliphila LW7]
MKEQVRASLHAQVRKQQRGIRASDIQTVVDWGKCIYKQGIRFFYLPKSLIRERGLSCSDGLSDLIVVLAGKDREMITCYKNPKALRRVKKKPKRCAKRGAVQEREY